MNQGNLDVDDHNLIEFLQNHNIAVSRLFGRVLIFCLFLYLFTRFHSLPVATDRSATYVFTAHAQPTFRENRSTETVLKCVLKSTLQAL